MLFALVANRALKPLSKLACTGLVADEAWMDRLEQVDDDTCYRSMDWLLEIEPEPAEQVYLAVADLLNLEVDLIFFDTTSTYFEIDEEDPAPEGAGSAFAAAGTPRSTAPTCRRS